jgi:HEAT repeat protein
METRSVPRLAAAIAAGAMAVCALSERALAHGGAYNPTPGGQPGGSSPSGPGPGTGAPGPATGPGQGGTNPATDATVLRASWEDWGHFNQDPYLDLKWAIGTAAPATGADEIVSGSRTDARPSPDRVRTRVVPALRELLETERTPEILGSTLVALARAGDPEGESSKSSAIPLLVKHLPDGNQEIAETAALSLGILQSEGSLPFLEALLTAGTRGKELVGGGDVPERTRAFAAYGLGLVADRAGNNRARQIVARSLCAALQNRRAASPDVEVAAVIALSLDRLEPERVASASAPWISRQTEMQFLKGIFEDSRRRPFVRAHAATALARLAQDAPEPLRADVAEQLLAAVKPHSKVENEVLQSAAQALGLLGDADGDGLDRKIRNGLGAVLDDPDVQARCFALVALAEIGAREGPADGNEEGSNACRNMISGELVRSRGMTRPWAAIALGVLERRILDRRGGTAGGPERPGAPASGAGGHLAPSQPVRETLRAYFASARQRMHIGTGAIALGLCRDRKAVPILLDRLRETTEDQGQGFVALALGMIGAEEAVKPLRELARTSKYRPAVLEEAAIALALLGDKSTATDLAEMLAKAQGQSAQLSLANALGKIGDDRTVDPLLNLIGRKDLTSSARAFAAAALGQVADKDLLPWFSPISCDLNYLAKTGTLLAGDGTGLLEIL